MGRHEMSPEMSGAGALGSDRLPALSQGSLSQGSRGFNRNRTIRHSSPRRTAPW